MSKLEPPTLLLVAEGMLAANLYKSLLEAQGVQVLLRHEAAGTVFGINVGPIGEVEIYVPAEQHADALAIVEAYRSGELERSEGGAQDSGE